MKNYDEKIELKGLIHKGLSRNLINLAVGSIIYGLISIGLIFFTENEIVKITIMIIPFVALVIWLLFIFLRKDKLKFENGNLYLNDEDIKITGYKTGYFLNPRIHLTLNDEKILFVPYVNKYNRAKIAEKISNIENFLENEKITEDEYKLSYYHILGMAFIIILGIVAPAMIISLGR